MTQWKSRIVAHGIVAPGSLVANPLHHHTHPAKQSELLAASIGEVGFLRSVTVNKTTGNLVDGHERVEQAIKSKQRYIDVEYVELTESEERLALATLDEIGGMATIDPEKLEKLLAELQPGDDALKEMLADMERAAGLDTTGIEETETPEPPADPVTQPGDLWLLGDHRVLCGDSTKAEDVARVMVGESVNVAITSPPYASQRDYDTSSGFKPVSPDNYVIWFEPVQKNILHHLAGDGSWFLNIKEHCEDGQRVLYVKDLVIAHVREWGWSFIDEFVWRHGGTPKGVKRRFKNAFEPVFQFAPGRYKFFPDAVKRHSANVPKGDGSIVTRSYDKQGVEGAFAKALRGEDRGSPGLAYPSNCLSLGHNHDALGHAAVYPVTLPTFFIKAYSEQKDLIYDPFLGSGTTLIAAEQLNRKCYGIEISPAYCDVIVDRWEKLTGKKAKRKQEAQKNGKARTSQNANGNIKATR